MKPVLFSAGLVSLQFLTAHAASAEPAPAEPQQPSSSTLVASAAPAGVTGHSSNAPATALRDTPAPVQVIAPSMPAATASPNASASGTRVSPAASESPPAAVTSPAPIARPQTAAVAPNLDFSKPAPLAFGALAMTGPSASAPPPLPARPLPSASTTTSGFLTTRETKGIAASSRPEATPGKPTPLTDPFNVNLDQHAPSGSILDFLSKPAQFLNAPNAGPNSIAAMPQL